MPITVHCPRCHSIYHLDPSMNGQRLRCPNTICRAVFEVHAEELPPAPDQAMEPPAIAYGGGTPHDAVEFLPVEMAAPAPQDAVQDEGEATVPQLSSEVVQRKAGRGPREVHSWHEPPPVRRGHGQTARPVLPPASVLEPPAPPDETPVERTWEPPSLQPAAAREPVTDTVRQRRRTSSFVALGMVLLGLGVIACGAWYVWSRFVATEDRQHAEARREYDDGKFAAAAQKFHQLEKKFSQSDSLLLYRFFAQLSEVRHDATALVEPREALERLQGFLQAHGDSPLLKDYRVDLWETAHRLLQSLIDKASEDSSPQLLDLARELLALTRKLKPADMPDDRGAQAESRIEKLAADLAQKDELQRARDMARKLPPTQDSLKTIADLLKRFQDDPELKAILAQKQEAVRSRVTYVHASVKLPLPDEVMELCLLVAPLVAGPVPAPTANGRVVLALVRGVLYGLDQGNGQVLWASRVGLDTTTLPVRLPATATSPEVFLVLSAERNTLRAVEAQTGESLWEHRLSAPCLSRPVLIQRRAYVPTLDGRIEEIEIIRGHQLGYFELPGQRLTAGAVWQPDTDLLYVPGDSQTVYVLDVTKKQCVATLATEHPAGSLRSAPVLINRPDPAGAGNPENVPPAAYLVLCQADGLGAMKLRVFDVVPEQKSALLALTPEPRVRGWTWFPAYHDGEKLAFVTDTGMLGVYGVNQVRNADQALFPELRDEYQLGPATGQRPGGSFIESSPQRAQVVHAGENDFWVLANGQLQRLHLNRFAQQVAPVWPKPHWLGAPLHEGQADESGQVLFVVTRTEEQTCLATAVRAADGKVLWQRQLGVECPTEPLVTPKDVIALDAGGGVFALDLNRRHNLTGIEWVLVEQLLARPLAGGLLWPRAALSRDDGAVIVVGATAGGKELVIRRFAPATKGGKPEHTEERAAMRASLAGPPALGAEHVLLPLRDGSLYRVPLAAVARGGHAGPDWRSERADEDAPGYISWISTDEFLATDGLRGVKRWRWRAGDIEWKEEGRGVLPARVVSPPVVLPGDRVLVADSQGGLTLLQGPRLKEARAWTLEGRITAGPFVRGPHVGCVVEGRRLVWLDPARDTPLWDYSTPGDGIVGQPQLVGRLLVVADLSGRFVALDPATGRPHGPGTALKAGVAPSTAPVAFGPGRALVPLTDGTLFLLPLEQLAAPVLEFPWVW